MVINPRQSGVVAICECGSKQFIPSESAIRTGILYCPCGHLEKLDMKVFNKIMAMNFRYEIWKKTGRMCRPAVSSEEIGRLYRHDQSGKQRTLDFGFEPLA